MKTTTRIEYVADDGTVFRNLDDCREHEATVATVAGIMAPMLPAPKIDYDSYYQHAPNTVRATLLALLRYIEAQAPNDKDGSNIDWCRRNYEFMPGPVSSAWFRFYSTNLDLGREYDQPYGASHPAETAKYKRMNP